MRVSLAFLYIWFTNLADIYDNSGWFGVDKINIFMVIQTQI